MTDTLTPLLNDVIVSYLQSNVTYGFAIYSQCSVRPFYAPDASVASPLAAIMDQRGNSRRKPGGEASACHRASTHENSLLLHIRLHLSPARVSSKTPTDIARLCSTCVRTEHLRDSLMDIKC